MEDFEAKLGPFFRHIRKRRGLKIRDVAAGVSETTLSRFERGQIDLTIAKLAPAIESAEIDPEDLLLQASRVKQAFTCARTQIETAAVLGNVGAAEAAIHAYDSVTENLQLPLRKFKRMVLKYRMLYISDPLVYMTPEEQDDLVDFLTADDDWHRFEYMLVNNLIYFMDEHASERCLRLMRRSFQQRRHPVDDEQEYKQALLSAMRRPLATRNMTMAHEVARMLASLQIGPVEPLMNFHRHLFHLTLTYLDDPTEANLAAIDNILAALEAVGSCDMAAAETRWLLAIDIPITHTPHLEQPVAVDEVAE